MTAELVGIWDMWAVEWEESVGNDEVKSEH